MVYLTGDIHGAPERVCEFASKMQLSESDVIILLGDVGANYYENARDLRVKHLLNSTGATVLCIHGNHEARPDVNSYKLIEWRGGKVWVEDKFPNVLFAKDGEIYSLCNMNCMAIGGAYSVDKYYRILKGYKWWSDEQPTQEDKDAVEIAISNNTVDVILSHTCPFKYEPAEMFLSGIDQSMVDDSTERWLDTIEENTSYLAWYCGHWHTNKRIDKMHFLYDGWEALNGRDE